LGRSCGPARIRAHLGKPVCGFAAIPTFRHRRFFDSREPMEQKAETFGGAIMVWDDVWWYGVPLPQLQVSGGAGGMGSDQHAGSKDHPLASASGENLMLGVPTPQVAPMDAGSWRTT
jgi:hypothetical protein